MVLFRNRTANRTRTRLVLVPHAWERGRPGYPPAGERRKGASVCHRMGGACRRSPPPCSWQHTPSSPSGESTPLDRGGMRAAGVPHRRHPPSHGQNHWKPRLNAVSGASVLSFDRSGSVMRVQQPACGGSLTAVEKSISFYSDVDFSLHIRRNSYSL